MESTKSTPSVIAKLMGLDYQLPQQPDLKRQRVLSENYLKKSNMIGMHERSVLYSGISSSIATSKNKERQDFHEEMPMFDSAKFRSIMDGNVDLSTNRIVCSKMGFASTQHPLMTEKLHLEELVNLPQGLNYDKVLGYTQHSELHPKNSLKVHQLDELPGQSGYHRAEKFLSNVVNRKCNTYSNSSEATIPGNYLRSLRMFNKGSPSSCYGEFDIYNSPKLLKFGTYSKVNILLPTRIVVLRPSPGRTSDSAQCTSLTKVVAQSKNGRENKNGKIYGKTGNVGLSPVFPEIIDRTIYAKKQLSKRETTLRLSSYKGTSDAKVGHNTHSFINGSSLTRLDGKQIFDKWRNNKISETNKLGDRICDVENFSRPMDNELEHIKSFNQSSQQDQKLQSGNSLSISNIFFKVGSSSFDKFGSEEPDLFSSHNLENENIHGHEVFRPSSASDLNSDSDMNLQLNGDQVSHHEKECRPAKDDMSEDSPLIESIPPCISDTMVENQHKDIGVLPSETLMKHKSPLKVWDSSSIKTSPYYFDEPRLDTTFSRKPRVINQKSPNSVLELQLPKENTPVSEIFESENDDYYGLLMQVQCLNSKSEETYSEGSGLAVSSDEDSEEVSFHLSQDTQKILGRYLAEENKNFSYMQDILEKAELAFINSEHYLRAWNSSEYLVDPSVSEQLELKYGKQTSWAKSERKLLFDRVNVGVKEILNNHIGICTFEKSVRRRRFTGALGTNELEEELWMFLTSEEKDVCKDLADKILDKEIKWLQLSEDVQTICKDIENVLFSELVGEIVYIPGL